jgi:hypothetical protein
MFFKSDLPKGTMIPYCGATMLQTVDEKDLNSPKELESTFFQSWDKICVLGHQPVVTKGEKVGSQI